MDKHSRVLVLGASGMVGSAIARALIFNQYASVYLPNRAALDLQSWTSIGAYFEKFRPEYVFMAAGKVGGIQANIDAPADFLAENLILAAHVTYACHIYEVKKLLYLGSSCQYPRDCAQPMRTDDLLSGPLEPTNRGYALAKSVGIELCAGYRKQYGCNFISAIPCNLYGPNDHYDPVKSHVMAALIRKFCEAKPDGVVEVWGSGEPFREFLHVDDLARACLLLMEQYDGAEPVNVGASQDISIRDLAELIALKAGFTGEIQFDPSKPDGMMHKLLDSSRIRGMGWMPEISLEAGIERTIKEYRARI